MFQCTDCHIAFPSAALLSNHRQRFCVSSRVDLASQRLLRGDAPADRAAPSRADYFTGRPQQQQQQGFGGGGAPPRPSPFARLPPMGGGGAGSGALPTPYDGPRSFSAEPALYPQNPSPFGGFGAGYGANGGGGGGGGDDGSFDPLPPLRGGRSVDAARAAAALPLPARHAYGAGDALSPAVQRQLEQQQIQIQMLQALVGRMSPAMGGGGNGHPHPHRMQAQQQQLQLQYGPYNGDGGGGGGYGGGGLGGMAEALVRMPMGGLDGYVLEGRYGLRVFAAEGLLAFHTVADHTPVTVAIRQFYCRRRIGNYLPELEQRDEWEFTQRRAVTAAKRDGYVNFGRAEYIFNVVTAHEVLLVVEVLSKSRLVGWAEVMLDALGDKVRRLRHPPVDIAGVLRDVSLRSTTATIGVELFRARWDAMGFDGNDEEEARAPPPPRPRTPQTPPPLPRREEPPKIQETCRFCIDEIRGVPFNVLATRVVVHTSKTSSVGDMGDAVAVGYQTDTSPAASPAFTLATELLLGARSCAIVFVEAIVEVLTKPDRPRVRVVLGHCAIPLRVGMSSGNFVTRVRRGDPDKQVLIPAVPDANDYMSCLFLKYRIDSTDFSRTFVPVLMPMRDWEIVLEGERARRPAVTPAESKIPTAAMVEAFRIPINRENFDTSFCALYNLNRGLALNVECIRGVGAELAAYKVIVEVGGNLRWTRRHDFSSDIGVPKFADPPFFFTGVPHNTFTCALFKIVKITNPADDATRELDIVAWGVAKLFLQLGALRNGRFTIPLFSGEVHPSFLKELQTQQLENVVLTWLQPKDKNGNLLKPLVDFWNFATLTYGQGDPLRVAEFTEQYETRPQAKVILVPESKRANFPLTERGGEKNIPASQLHGNKDPEAVTAAINALLIRECPDLA